MGTDSNDFDYKAQLARILGADLADMEKLAEAFNGLTGFIIESAQRQIEVARAMGDREEVTKQQVKMETMKHARKVFQQCHWHVTGRWAWDE